jgi:RHS repeat-associated protein
LSKSLASNGSCAGSYYSAELVVAAASPYPTAGWLYIRQCASGSLSTLATTTVALAPGYGSRMRTVVFGTNLWVYVGGTLVVRQTISLTSGHPGAGGYDHYQGAFLAMNPWRIGPHDTYAPNNAGFIPYETTTADLYGHGTHVADIIAGDGTNGAFGEKLGQFSFVDLSTCPCTMQVNASNVWFAGRKIWDGPWNYGSSSWPAGSMAPMGDRTGNNRVDGARYYPYGEQIGGFSATANNHEKFGTYTRDSFTGLDYADQRYYASTYGRFTTVDRGPANLGAPQTLNRYTYVGGDPVNSSDPSGLCAVDGNGNWWDGEPNGLWSPFPGRCKDNPSWLRMAGNGVYYEDQWYVYTVPPEPDPCWSVENAGGCGSGAGEGDGTSQNGGGGGGAATAKARFAGPSEAENALLVPKCAELITGLSGRTADQLGTLLRGATITIGTTFPGNDLVTIASHRAGGRQSYSYRYQWGYTTGGDIELNGHYFPDPTQQNITVPGGTTSLLNLVNNTLKRNLDATQFGTLVFLHELTHIANGYSQSIDTNEFNNSIIEKCIH